MTVSIDLPRLIGTRDAAIRLLEQQDIPLILTDERVCIDARDLSTATSSFTDELLDQLARRHAHEIVIVRAPSEFKQQVTDSISAHNWTNVSIKSLATH